MRKLYTTIIVSILTLSLLGGCASANIFKQFNKAVAKTAGIKKASQSFDFQISVDMQNSKLNPQEKQMLELYNNLKGSITTKYDKEKKISYTEGHVTLNNIGFDFKVYNKDKKIIIEMPLFSKYLVIDENKLNNSNSGELKVEEASKEKMKALLDDVITKEKVKKLNDKKKLISGNQEVNATEFELTLGEADIKKLITTVIDIVMSDKEIKNSILSSAKAESQGALTDAQAEEQLNTMVNEIKSCLDKVKIENFSYKGNFTKDMYILEDNASADLTIQLPESESLKAKLSVTSKTWDIGKDITVDLPAINNENSFTPEQMNQYIGEMFGAGVGTTQQ